LADAEAVKALQNVAVGQTVEITLGGKRPSISGPAVTVSATVLKHTDGEFEVEDRHSHFVSARGTRIKMGKSVLIKTGGVCILLNTLATAPNDLGQWRCMGIDPESLRFIGVKAAVAHRQAYDRISRRSYTVSTPGPCTSDLLSLPYKKLRRPIFPFDNLSGIPIPALL
jgi:microcystin degradation protein MlrC